MTQTSEYYIINVGNDGTYMFSAASGESHYKMNDNCSRAEVIKTSNRSNIRDLFADVPFTNRFNQLYRLLQTAHAHYSYGRNTEGNNGLCSVFENLQRMKANVDLGYGSSAAFICPECGWIYTSHIDAIHSLVCPRCCSIAVKYNKENFQKLTEYFCSFADGFATQRPKLSKNFDRINDMIDLVKDNKIRINYHGNQIYFSVVRSHFERPEGHRFRRYANVVAWDSLFRDGSNAFKLDAGYIYLARIFAMSDEKWNKALAFLKEHGHGLMGEEFYCAGDERVISERRRAYVGEYIASGRGRSAIIDKLFHTCEDEIVEEVSAELMRRLPMKLDYIDSIVSSDGTVQLDELFESIKPADVHIQIYDICCGNESCLNAVRNSLREEYRLA